MVGHGRVDDAIDVLDDVQIYFVVGVFDALAAPRDGRQVPLRQFAATFGMDATGLKDSAEHCGGGDHCLEDVGLCREWETVVHHFVHELDDEMRERWQTW